MFKLNWLELSAGAYDELRASALKSSKNREKSKKAKSSKSEGLFKQVDKTILLLSQNPRHPGLRTHEYSSLPNPFDSKQKVFEAYAQNQTSGAYRVFWCYGPGTQEITIIAITAHP